MPDQKPSTHTKASSSVASAPKSSDSDIKEEETSQAEPLSKEDQWAKQLSDKFRELGKLYREKGMKPEDKEVKRLKKEIGELLKRNNVPDGIAGRGRGWMKWLGL